MNDHKHILIGVTGGIAAYKSAELIRLLTTKGAQVRVVMTEGAKQFITPLTLQTLSGHKIYDSLWQEDSNMSHIDLARWAELIIIAPATAHLIAKLAAGFADDLLTTLCLATTAPIALAPAMNRQMWANAACMDNIAKLRSRNFIVLGPGEGSQACGETGPGRLLEPMELLQRLSELVMPKLLAAKHVVITAGSTQEAIDPVRYLSNHSSGKMGYALAEAALAAGAKVTLISGPCALNCSPQIDMIKVKSAEQMLSAVLDKVEDCDIFIGCAAVSDYRPQTIAAHKIKKHGETLTLELVRNPDILQEVSQLAKRPFIVGFAAETENLLSNASQKLQAKNLDMIAANLVGDELGFGTDDNALNVLTANQTYTFNRAPKSQLAKELIELIAENIQG